ncbi:SMP-30/gluconolactonase/LRE family protein [Xylophilus sp. Leaf220]|uniref:SMP-30/gluconolactonase/LRE family protein n=1 Tax=Xylophilus sp. Leaf220 TaxID=1735686 RepID=UPI0006F44B3E|nr:SMP-30/gluconolactonase/LRE family protein [Xylophilus sp. Leaf220]KQM71079.1 gluconolactonase [Xylophilus sp. Leaf220]
MNRINVDLSRRSVITGALAAGAAGLANAQAFDFKPNQRYPDPAVQVLDPSFAKYRLFSSSVEQIATGFRWVEGPVWFGDGRYLLFSDIPNNRIMRWDEATGQTGVFRNPSNFSNGLGRDRQGRLLACEHLTRRVTRTEYDGSITVLADRFEGKRLNSPNDIVARSDGSVWFTDPPFGIGGHWEGEKQASELPQAVYRIDPSGRLDRVLESRFPNGLAFTPDEKQLYLVERTAEGRRQIVRYDVTARQGLANPTVVVEGGTGALDGFKVDEDGNLWCGWGSTGAADSIAADLDGVMVFNPSGKPIAHIRLPERCPNLVFGGPKRNRLFMASSHSVYSLYVETRGI